MDLALEKACGVQRQQRPESAASTSAWRAATAATSAPGVTEQGAVRLRVWRRRGGATPI